MSLSVGKVLQSSLKPYSKGIIGLRVVVPKNVINGYLSDSEAVKADMSLGDALQKLWGWSSMLLPKGAQTKINNAVLQMTNVISNMRGDNWARELRVRSLNLDEKGIFVRVGLRKIELANGKQIIKDFKDEAEIPIIDMQIRRDINEVQTGVRDDINENLAAGYQSLLRHGAAEAKVSRRWRDDERAFEQIFKENMFDDVDNAYISINPRALPSLFARMYPEKPAERLSSQGHFALGGLSKFNEALKEYERIAEQNDLGPLFINKFEVRKNALVAKVSLKAGDDGPTPVYVDYFSKGSNPTLTDELVAVHQNLSGHGVLNVNPFNENEPALAFIGAPRPKIQADWFI